MNQPDIIKGKTAKKFDAVTKKWCNLCARYINYCSIDELSRKLEPVVPELNEFIQEVQVQGQQYMSTQLKLATDEEIKEYHLVEKMNKLDEMIKSAARKERTNQRLLPTPEQVIRGVSCREKDKETKLLLEEFIKIQEENDSLMIKVSILKNELSSKRKNITNDVEKFKKSTMIANTIPVDELLDTMNKMDLLPERG